MIRRPKYLSPVRDGQRWLVSYTDVLTLLLILFIAVAAQAVSKPEVHVAAVAPAVPAPLPPPLAPAAPVLPQPPESQSHEALVRAGEKLKERGIDLKLEARGLVISLPQAVLSTSGDDRINASARSIILDIADAVRDLDNKIELAGHA